ncbi:hypothetical protein KIPB_006284, partial [Kipferlia bialata]|eukprot:g6284.t1
MWTSAPMSILVRDIVSDAAGTRHDGCLLAFFLPQVGRIHAMAYIPDRRQPRIVHGIVTYPSGMAHSTLSLTYATEHSTKAFVSILAKIDAAAQSTIAHSQACVKRSYVGDGIEDWADIWDSISCPDVFPLPSCGEFYHHDITSVRGLMAASTEALFAFADKSHNDPPTLLDTVVKHARHVSIVSVPGLGLPLKSTMVRAGTPLGSPVPIQALLNRLVTPVTPGDRDQDEFTQEDRDTIPCNIYRNADRVVYGAVGAEHPPMASVIVRSLLWQQWLLGLLSGEEARYFDLNLVRADPVLSEYFGHRDRLQLAPASRLMALYQVVLTPLIELDSQIIQTALRPQDLGVFSGIGGSTTTRSASGSLLDLSTVKLVRSYAVKEGEGTLPFVLYTMLAHRMQEVAALVGKDDEEELANMLDPALLEASLNMGDGQKLDSWLNSLGGYFFEDAGLLPREFLFPLYACLQPLHEKATVGIEEEDEAGNSLVHNENYTLRVSGVDSGTWPADGGGVAQCRRDLVNNLPRLRWDMFAEIGNAERVVQSAYQVQSNVHALSMLPLWGREMNGGFDTALSAFPSVQLTPLVDITTREAVRKDFIPIFRQFVRVLIQQGRFDAFPLQHVVDLFSEMWRYFKTHAWAQTWECPDVTRVWREEWADASCRSQQTVYSGRREPPSD